MKTSLIVICIFCAIVTFGIMGSDDLYDSFEMFFAKFESFAMTIDGVVDIPANVEQASQTVSGFFSMLWDGFKSIFVDPIVDLFGGGSDNLTKPIG